LKSNSLTTPFAEVRIDQVEDDDALDRKALQVREKWQLGIDPIPSMTALLEDKGLKVIETDLPERINGMACHVERADLPPTEVIVVARQTNVERKRFNLAHELAHRIIAGTENPSIRLEPAMNRFAGAFLVPAEHLTALAGENQRGVTYHEIMRLKRTYGVSAAAMLMRLGQVGILSRAAVEYAFKTYAPGGYAPFSNFRTGMPSFLALSARFSWMPLPGKTRTPTGSTSSMASLRLKGAALACLVQSGLKATCVTLAGFGPFGGDEFGALGAATVEKDHVGILGPDLIELAPDQAVIVEVGPTGEGDLGACGQHHFGFRAALGGQEIAAVDQRCGQVLVVHHRASAGPPG
jgi:Zn-dependent peptidase ImmA (M78 family)